MFFRKKTSKVSRSHDEIVKLIEDIVQNSNGDITIARNTVSFPVTDTTAGNLFHGGLTDEKTMRLIEKAVLMRGVQPWQALLPLPDNFDIHKLPKQDEVVFFGGILLNNFGHFLLESLGRLWAYHLFANFGLRILFYAPWGTSDYLKKENYIYQALSGLGIPPELIIFCKNTERFQTVVIPTQIYGFGISRKPDPKFVSFVNGFKIPAGIKPMSPVAERIYVSRSGLPFRQGRPIAETLFETFLQVNNYKVIHPEKLPLYQQLLFYKHAKQIIFCDGGAMYIGILMPYIKAEIAIVARRRDYRGNWKDITEFFSGYQKQTLWIDEVVCQYQFGMETYDSLAEVDWHKVSLALQEAGYVESVFNEIVEGNFEDIKKKELLQYIDSIRTNPGFINYMLTKKEQYTILPSTL